MKIIVTFLLSLFSVGIAVSQELSTQRLITQLVPTASDAVLPITFWVDHSAPGQQDLPVESGVVGTGFIVNDRGYFITAAHVAKIKEIGPKDRPVKVRLTAVLRQGSGDGTGMPFTVIEIDEAHDLALCQINGFRVYLPADSPIAKLPRSREKGALTLKQMAHPFASLSISKRQAQLGNFILLGGFPLGSWTPAIQFGIISAVRTIYPPSTPVAGVPAGQRELLQISVSANHGNSGCPVIDLSSGQVVGVILQIVPAPLAMEGRNIWNSGTYDMSGIMLAAPASWIEALLTRHGVKSQRVRAGKYVIG